MNDPDTAIAAREAGALARAAHPGTDSEQDAHLRALMQLSTAGVIQIAAQPVRRLLRANPLYCSLAGYSLEELLQLTASDMTHPDDRAQESAALADIASGKRTEYRAEQRLMRKDGPAVWVSVLVYAVRDLQGGALYLVAIAQDISTRVQAETQLKRHNAALEQRIADRAAVVDELYADLRASEERYRTLVELSPDAMFVNQDHQIAYINNAGLRFFGARSRAEIVGRSAYELLDPDTVAIAKARTTRMLAEDRSSPPMETKVRCLDGTVREVEIMAAPVLFQGGRAVQAIYRDIGERKRAERVLQATQQRLAFLIASTDAVIYSLKASEDNRATFMSENVLRMTGYHARQFTDDPHFCRSRIHPEDAGTVEHRMREAWRRRESFVLEYRFLCKDGQYRWMHDTAQPSSNETGQIEEWNGYWVDISERKRTQQELQAHQAEMETLRQQLVIGHTVAAIAHELNQPLNAIASYNEAALRLLQAGNPKPDRLAHVLEHSAKQAQRAGKTMRDLLTALEARPPSPEAVDLEHCVRLAIEVFDAERGGDTKVSLHAPHALPRAHAVALQVQQVLLNLFHNGADAMRGAAEPRMAVSVRRADEAGFLQVSVRDQGPGVDASIAANIFQTFVTTKPHGVGMGLAISRSLIEAQGGKLWLDSAARPGACFHFTLPIFN